MVGSAAKHSHSHEAWDLPSRNLHAHLTPQERLERLFMFLEAQFGADNVAPVTEPKLPPLATEAKKLLRAEEIKEEVQSDASMDVSEDEEEGEKMLKARAEKEIARLHKLGIPVPGVAIKVDKMEATVWLEDLEVDCKNRVFADRVRSVVERAVEVIAPLYR